MNRKEKIKTLEHFIATSKNIVVFTGAGISVASGIPDFRSPNGLYKKKRNISLEEVLSHHYFVSHPESFYRFLKSEMLYSSAKPNMIHVWIKELEAKHQVTIITQNIDSLHQKAGSKNVLELHGNISSYYCTKCGKTYSSTVLNKELPTCICKGLIRPNIVLYEEPLDEDVFNEAIFAILRADMLLVIGSSLIVTPASNLLSYYEGERFIIINQEATPFDSIANLVFHEDILKVIKTLNQ